ncbi:hypothetical protein F5880DRAFT_1506811 [Lentinula raphanica]|nr:hypothetical protein F5880DRAFT_1506811 [Lentinula raphanica]
MKRVLLVCSRICVAETSQLKQNLRQLSSDDHEPSGNPIELKNASTFHDLQRFTLGFGASVEMPAIDDGLSAGLTSGNSLDISMPDVTCGKGLVADGGPATGTLSVYKITELVLFSIFRLPPPDVRHYAPGKKMRTEYPEPDSENELRTHNYLHQKLRTRIDSSNIWSVTVTAEGKATVMPEDDLGDHESPELNKFDPGQAFYSQEALSSCHTVICSV